MAGQLLLDPGDRHFIEPSDCRIQHCIGGASRPIFTLSTDTYGDIYSILLVCAHARCGATKMLCNYRRDQLHDAISCTGREINQVKASSESVLPSLPQSPRCTASFAAFRAPAITTIESTSLGGNIALVKRSSSLVVVARPLAVSAAALVPPSVASALAFTSKRADAGKEPPAHVSTSRPVVAIRSVSFLRLAVPAPHRVLVPPPPAAAAPPPRPRQVGRKIRHWSLQHQHCLLQDVALHSGSEEVATKVPLAPTNTSVLAILAWILMTGLPPRHL